MPITMVAAEFFVVVWGQGCWRQPRGPIIAGIMGRKMRMVHSMGNDRAAGRAWMLTWHQGWP